MKSRLKKIFKVAVTLLLIILLNVQPLLIYAQDDISNSFNKNYLEGVMDMLQDKYYTDITFDHLYDNAVKGIFNSLDPYTVFYTKEEAESFFNTMEGTYTGIGIQLEKSDGLIYVSGVFKDSPADRAGIAAGDIIRSVDGKNIIDMSTEEVASLILGEEGTKVKLGIQRRNDSTIHIFDMERKSIYVNPVTYNIINGIGYIKIDIFNNNSAECFSKAINVMEQSKISKIILDLRGNPGGDVYQAAEIASAFVPEGVITTLDFKSESSSDITLRSDLAESRYQLAVLVDSMSASASEIVAGAIQDTGAGTLIGSKTFGKAKVQNIFPVLTREAFEKYSQETGASLVDAFKLLLEYGIQADDSEIAGYAKITTGLYYTPKGRMIDNKGITPDITVPDPKYYVSDLSAIFDGINGDKLLKEGVSDFEVRNLERFLSIKGYDVGTPDFYFDKNTKNAVIKYQASVNIKKDGIVGKQTREKIKAEMQNALLTYDLQYARAVEVLQ